MVSNILLITGAASGIGRALSLQAAEKGATVIATDYHEAGLTETQTLAQNKGFSIIIHPLDVSNAEAIVDFAAKIIPTLQGKRLVLVNNAGVSLLSGNFAKTSLEEFEWLMNINFWGVVRMTKAFYPYFLQENQGHIVNISSIFGLGGVADNAAYCSAKFGVRGFTETLRMELLGTNVRTTSVHPGGVKTNIVKSGRLGAQHPQADKDKTVNRFAKQALSTPEKAASDILHAIETGKERVVIGRDGYLFDFITRLFPVLYSKIVRKSMSRTFDN